MLVWSLALSLLGGELRWQAPAECPTAQEVRGRIDAAGGLGELTVDAEVTSSERGWSLALSIGFEQVADARTLHADDCEALAEALVLLVATRLDDAAPQRAPEPAVPTPETAQTGLEPVVGTGSESGPSSAWSEPEPRAAPVVVSGRRLATGFVLGLGAGVGLGSVPAPGIPIELTVGHAWPRLRVGARGRFHAAREVELDERRSMRVLLGTGGVFGCGRFWVRTVELPLCGEVSFGGNRAVVRGPARQRGGVWIEAGARVGVAWFVSPRWALTGQLAAAAPLVGSAFTLGEDDAWSPAPVVGRALLGVEVLFPIQNRARPEN